VPGATASLRPFWPGDKLRRLTIKRLAIIVLKNGLLLAALVVTTALSAITTMRVVLSSQEVVVPSLVQKRVPEARKLASAQGLELRVEGKRFHPSIPADKVVAQEPAAGSTLKSARSVKVWISQGPRRIVVPAVEGQTLRTARLRLEDANITVGRVIEVDDAAPEGTILVQSPPAGETEPDFDAVSLLVSRGRYGADYVMPDLIGRKAEEVLGALNQTGLKVADVRYRAYPGVEPGIILRQLPAAGYRVGRQTPVSLDVSKGAGTP
jgi:beta-lactam-binding protein with PASTA domain